MITLQNMNDLKKKNHFFKILAHGPTNGQTDGLTDKRVESRAAVNATKKTKSFPFPFERIRFKV